MSSQARTIADGVDDFEPTANANGKLDLTWNVSDELIQIEKTIGEFKYRKTLTWVGGVPTVVSAWIQV